MTGDLKKATAGGKFLGSILLFLVFALLFGIGCMLHRFLPAGDKDLDVKRGDARSTKLEALQKENEQKLTTYAWVNKDKQIVQIPIEQAMKLVAVDLATKAVKRSEVKVENPYPYGLQDVPAPAASGSAAATPAPAASGSAAPPAAPAGSGTTVAPATPAAPAATPTPGQ